MTLTTGMSLTATGIGCMKHESKETGHFCSLGNHVAAICPQVQVSLEEDSDQYGCFNERELSSDMRGPSLPVEDKSYPASLHLSGNEWLAFWLFLVASSYFLLSKNVNFFRNCRIKLAEKDRTSTIVRIENGETAMNSTYSCYASTWSSHTISSKSNWTGHCTKCDTYSEISDFDRTSYLDSLLSLEEEDSEWLSDSKPYGCCSYENPSTPLSYKCDSFSEISDIDTPNYWDSLLRLEGKDIEWILDSKQEIQYVPDGFPSPSYKGCCWGVEALPGCCWGVEALPSVPTISSLTGLHCDRSEDNISVEHLLETADMDEFSADEPLFWPFEGKLSWNSEDSWSSFCSSPRKRRVFDSGSTPSRIKQCKENGDEAACSARSETSRLSMWSKRSAKIVPLECEDQKVAIKRGEVLNDKHLSLTKILFNEDFASNKDLPLGREYFALDQELPIETLVGLKEFDGHEGLDSEFNGDVFMLDEYLH